MRDNTFEDLKRKAMCVGGGCMKDESGCGRGASARTLDGERGSR